MVALAGSIEDGAESALIALGLSAASSIVDKPMTIEHAMQNATALLTDAAERLARTLAIQ